MQKLRRGIEYGVCVKCLVPFVKKVPFFHKKVPFLANIEHCCKFLEYALVVELIIQNDELTENERSDCFCNYNESRRSIKCTPGRAET